MQATKETVQKRPHTALWVILCVVLLCAAGAALYFCRWAEKPLTLAEGYVAAEGLTADITDGGTYTVSCNSSSGSFTAMSGSTQETCVAATVTIRMRHPREK